MERPRSKVRLSDIPNWLITKLAYEGFEPKGNNGSFYKFENGYTYRISTHKTFVPSEKILTIIYEDIDELKNIKLSKFQKLTRKFEKKLERRLQRRERERNAKYERY